MTHILTALETRFPFIRWRQPVPVTWGSSNKFACRIFIAIDGLDVESPHQWLTQDEAKEHIKCNHIREQP
jgi:hypothetical protein